MAYRVCFVCMGNICRSPMAEAVLRSLADGAGLGREIEVSSAGTGGWHVGDDADPRALTTLRANGYDLRHSARQFAREWFGEHDLVVALDTSNLVALRRIAPTPEDADRVRLLRSYDPLAAATGDLDVPDPYYGGDDGFQTVLEMVERACEGLLDDLRGRLAGS